jgi:hypothetical protein
MNTFTEFDLPLFTYEDCNKMYTDWYKYEKCTPLIKLSELLNIDEKVKSIEVFKFYYQNSCHAEYYIDLEITKYDDETVTCRIYNEKLIEKRKHNILEYITAGRLVSSDDNGTGVIILVDVIRQKFEVDYLLKTESYSFEDFFNNTDLLVFYTYVLNADDILRGKMDDITLQSKILTRHRLKSGMSFITFNVDGKFTILV